MPPVIARRLAYFFSMGQVWDFLDVAKEKTRQAMEACVAAMEELKPVKQAESECLWKVVESDRGAGQHRGGLHPSADGGSGKQDSQLQFI